MTEHNREFAGNAELTDAEMVGAVLAGDLDAFEPIMRANNQRLFRVARSIVTDDSEAMDVVQEAYVKAFQNMAKLNEPDRLSHWLAKVTRNGALQRNRKGKRVQLMDQSTMDNVIDITSVVGTNDLPERRLANRELKAVLEKYIDELPEAFRTVFILRAIEHCSVQSTAEILDIKPATVKSRLHRARQLLQKRLLDFSDETGVAVHEFAGARCDAVVQNVMHALRYCTREPGGDATTHFEGSKDSNT